MNKILISVITVCLNAETVIEQTINSIVNQDFKDYEYLILDGQSSDATVEKLVGGGGEAFFSPYYKRILYSDDVKRKNVIIMTNGTLFT